MRRRQSVRSTSLIGLVASHPIARADRYTAQLISHSQTNHIVPNTKSSYECAIRDYVKFCRVRRLAPWPVDAIKMAGWLLILAQRVKATSLKMYMAALPYGQSIQQTPYPWVLHGSETLRRVLRYIRHRYPCSAKASKMPISLSLIATMAKHLAGWPDLNQLSYDDLLWLTASVIATSAFLRGGEFLSSPHSDRAILARSAISVRTIEGARVLVVSPSQPKARMHLSEVDIPCFAPATAGPLHPVALFEALCARSPLLRAQDSDPKLIPAFHHANGRALSRNYMVDKTSAMLQTAGVAIVCPVGNPTMVRASSWRAGGVRSATDANVSDSVIMEVGRWRSAAWRHYLFYSPLDIRGACQNMWDTCVNDDNVQTVVLQGGRTFGSSPSAMLASSQAVAYAKAQLAALIDSVSPSPDDREALLTHAQAMVEATASLLGAAAQHPLT
jgi:hypothetical protein